MFSEPLLRVLPGQNPAANPTQQPWFVPWVVVLTDWRDKEDQLLTLIKRAIPHELTQKAPSTGQVEDETENGTTLASPAWFKLTDQSLDTLRNKILPEVVLSRLKPLKDKELQRADFESELARLLSADEKDKFLNLILNHTASPMKNTIPIVLVVVRMESDWNSNWELIGDLINAGAFILTPEVGEKSSTSTDLFEFAEKLYREALNLQSIQSPQPANRTPTHPNGYLAFAEAKTKLKDNDLRDMFESKLPPGWPYDV